MCAIGAIDASVGLICPGTLPNLSSCLLFGETGRVDDFVSPDRGIGPI